MAGAREGPRSRPQPSTHGRGAGRDARPPHPPARGDSPAREPAWGLRAPACAPPQPAARLGKTSRPRRTLPPGLMELRAPPAHPPDPGCPRPGSDARAHVLPEGRFRSYPLQDPPKHGLASRRRRRGGLSAPYAGYSRLEGARAGSRAGRRAGKRRRWTRLWRPRLPHRRREAASTSQRGGSQRAPACRAAPVTDSWAGPPACGRGAGSPRPRLLGLAIGREGGAGGGPVRGFGQSEAGLA